MSSTETNQTLKYAGWIPTVAGRLSFRHIGESRFPSLSSYANVATNSARLILAIQNRNLSDAIFPRLTDRFTDHTGEFWFVLHAHNPEGSDAGNTITGKVFVFRADRWPEHHATLFANVKSMNRLNLSAESSREAQVEGAFEAARKTLIEHADISVSFNLTRTGEVYFGGAAFLDSEIQKASTEHAAGKKQDFQKWISDHGYFFLRDISHQHQHHVNSDDTILVLQEYDAADVKWREKIIYSLYYHIIRAKRSDHYPYAARALGVLAYCQSFKEISKPKFQSASVVMPAYNDAPLEASLKAKIGEDAAVYQQEETRAITQAASSTNTRIIVLTIMLITFTVFAIFAEAVSKNPANQKFASTLGMIFIPALKLFALGYMLIWAGTSKRVRHWSGVLELSNVYRLAVMRIYALASVVLFLLLLFLSRNLLGAIFALL